MNKVKAIDTTFAQAPFYNDLLKDQQISNGELIKNALSRTNEVNVEILPSSILFSEVPWGGMAFLGPNDIVKDAIDDNVLDCLRSRGENGSWPPGDRENLIDCVEGGRGMIGSFARAKERVFSASE